MAVGNVGLCLRRGRARDIDGMNKGQENLEERRTENTTSWCA